MKKHKTGEQSYDEGSQGRVMEDKPEWMKPSFVEAIQESRFRKKELYIGEDEEDITDDLNISDVIKCKMTLVTPITIRW